MTAGSRGESIKHQPGHLGSAGLTFRRSGPQFSSAVGAAGPFPRRALTGRPARTPSLTCRTRAMAQYNARYRPSVSRALAYARRGWPVFPCRLGGKAPATRHGFRDATTDAKQIRRWWERQPGTCPCSAARQGPSQPTTWGSPGDMRAALWGLAEPLFGVFGQQIAQRDATAAGLGREPPGKVTRKRDGAVHDIVALPALVTRFRHVPSPPAPALRRR
jgi:hypothetical protein